MDSPCSICYDKNKVLFWVIIVILLFIWLGCFGFLFYLKLGETDKYNALLSENTQLKNGR
jgi:hypothetical protein